MMIKKIARPLVLTSLVAGALVGCQSTATVDSQTATQPTTASSHTVAPWADKTFYQIFVRSFFDANGDGIGDLAGIEAKLDYIQDLGADALWLTPFHPSPTYHGYSVADYYRIHPDFGTLDDFKSLVNQADKKDIQVVMDLVVNHTSEEHLWFKAMLAGNPDYQNFYRCADSAPDGNWGEVAQGQFCYYSFGPQSGLPDLNYDNPAVRAAIKDVAKYWLDAGIDGFRLDVAQMIGDGDYEKSVAWWQEFQDYVRAIKPDTFIIGEVNFDQQNGNTQIARFYQGMNATFNFPLYNELLVSSAGIPRDPLAQLNQTRAEYGVYNRNFVDATLLGNHDRARIASELNFSDAKVRKAIATQMTLPGTPFIYYGDEIGMRGGHDLQGDPHKREPMDWYQAGQGAGMAQMTKAVYAAKAKNIVANDGISVEEQMASKDSLYHYYKQMIALRKAHPIFIAGDYVRVGVQPGIYSYLVQDDTADYQLLVAHNQELTKPQTLTLTAAAQELISGQTLNAGDRYTIPEFGSAIFKTQAHTTAVALAPIPEDTLDNSDVTLSVMVNVPEDTPADTQLFMPNSDDGWDPAVVTTLEQTTLTRVSDSQFKIDIVRPRGSRLEFKFFRGSWENSETDAEGHWTGNRVFLFVDDQAQMDVNIQGWRDVDFKG